MRTTDNSRKHRCCYGPYPCAMRSPGPRSSRFGFVTTSVRDPGSRNGGAGVAVPGDRAVLVGLVPSCGGASGVCTGEAEPALFPSVLAPGLADSAFDFVGSAGLKAVVDGGVGRPVQVGDAGRGGLSEVDVLA